MLGRKSKLYVLFYADQTGAPIYKIRLQAHLSSPDEPGGNYFFHPETSRYGYFDYLWENYSATGTMSEKYVVRLKNAAIYHADNPFGNTSADKLIQRGEMVLSDVDLCVSPGEFVYLLGRVGSGKSTLLKTLYAEVQLLAGEGHVAGYDLRRLKRRDIPYLRRRIGIVFQDYQLLTDRNVFMNLYYVMKATGWKREEEIRERIDQVLKLVDLGAKSYKMPFELSGGEQQRLVIARALLNNPQVLLADEPTGNLDPVTAEGIMQLFQEIADRGCAVVMSTHNTALIENHPARAILFSQGKIREVDLKAELG